MRTTKFLGLAALFALAGCNFAPSYERPHVATPDAYKEIGPWSPVAAQTAPADGDWWAGFGDPVLNDLEGKIESGSPRLAVAVARYDQARGITGQLRGSLLPSIDVRGSAQRVRLSANRPLQSKAAEYNDYVVGGALSYELDLWGRVRNLVAQGKANERASAADLEGVRLSLQAELAEDYLRLRADDAQIALLTDTVEAYARAYDLTVNRHDAGASSAIDVGRAETQLASTKAQLADLNADRALREHAIAALLGEPASTFAITPNVPTFTYPVVPVGVPSAILLRRPDIAAAERRVAAANAGIGIQKAAFFPQITLGVSDGYETSGVNLLTAPNTFWALGPAQGVLSVFDGGKRTAALLTARAQFDEAAANYRNTVLNGFRDVEDQMTLANRLAEEEAHQDTAVAAAARTSNLALVRYREGASDYLAVVTAQTAELQNETAQLSVRTRRLLATVDLIRALGGGWENIQ